MNSVLCFIVSKYHFLLIIKVNMSCLCYVKPLLLIIINLDYKQCGGSTMNLKLVYCQQNQTCDLNNSMNEDCNVSERNVAMNVVQTREAHFMLLVWSYKSAVF